MQSNISVSNFGKVFLTLPGKEYKAKRRLRLLVSTSKNAFITRIRSPPYSVEGRENLSDFFDRSCLSGSRTAGQECLTYSGLSRTE